MFARTIRFGTLVCLIALAWIVSLLAPSAAHDASPVASPVASPSAAVSWPSWVQLGPDNVILARAVRAESCPDIVIDGASYAMDVRASPTEAHPNVVCEAVVPPDSQSIAIDDRALPLPVAEPQRIAVLGDTGCRLKAPDSFQDCHDPSAWPFAQIAASAAAADPDLVIHVGDYIYRESPCPDGNQGCAGSPYGDTWATWQADFFGPASALLDVAPWILVRGNHEDCNREGLGWFRYLDPGPLPTDCESYTEPYALNIGPVRAVVLDAASAQDTDATDDVTQAFAPILDQALALADGSPTWLLTHKPIWSIGADKSGDPAEWSTATYDATGFSKKSAAFDLVIAGHVHMSQLVWFTPESERAPQLIAGDGGTELDDMATGMFDGSNLDDDDLAQGWRWQDFGFMVIQPVDNGFVAGLRMLDMSSPATCLSVGRELACLAS